MNPAEHIVPGSLWHTPNPKTQGKLPPLVPAMPLEEDSDWDADVVGHQYIVNTEHRAERRHSGWAAVEKRWSQSPVQPGQQQTQRSEKRQPSKEFMEITSKLHPSLSLPPPQLEMDFRMKVTLNSNVATMAVGNEHKNWTTFTEGVWSGSIGTGTVVGGGQDSVDIETGSSQGTQIESSFKLKTTDEPPALIDCKARGFRTGPEDIMKSLRDTAQAQKIDPRQYRHRIAITMRTKDARYADKVNFELWIGTCLWRGSEVIFDAYKVR